jgi:Flp pilus assembly pilin Flp
MPIIFTRIRRQLGLRRGSFFVEYSSLALLVAMAYIALFSHLGGGLPD